MKCRENPFGFVGIVRRLDGSDHRVVVPSPVNDPVHGSVHAGEQRCKRHDQEATNLSSHELDHARHFTPDWAVSVSRFDPARDQRLIGRDGAHLQHVLAGDQQRVQSIAAHVGERCLTVIRRELQAALDELCPFIGDAKRFARWPHPSGRRPVAMRISECVKVHERILVSRRPYRGRRTVVAAPGDAPPLRYRRGRLQSVLHEPGTVLPIRGVRSRGRCCTKKSIVTREPGKIP